MKRILYLFISLIVSLPINAQHYKKGDISIGGGFCSFLIKNLGCFITMDYDVKDFGGKDNNNFSILIGGDFSTTYNRELKNSIAITPDIHGLINWNSKLKGFNVYSGLRVKALIRYNYKDAFPEGSKDSRLDMLGLAPSIPLGFKYFFNDKFGLFVDFAFPIIENRIGAVYKF